MKKILYLFMIIIIFLIPLKTHAAEVLFGAGASFNLGTNVVVNSDRNSLPYTFSGGPGTTTNLGNVGLSLSPSYSGSSVLEAPTFTYLNFTICTTIGGTNLTINISNSSCTGSCLRNGIYTGTYLNTTDTINNYTCNKRLFVIPIQKWKYGEYSEQFEVDSFLNFKNNASYTGYSRIDSVFLSDVDLSITYKNQEELNNKLNSINTAITNMQNSINNNANTNTQNIINNNNTNTQNIINNQNTNAQQAHNDAQNIQNAIKDDNVNSNTGKSFFDNFSDNTHGLSGIITAPLNIIQQLINVNPTSCSALSTTYHNKTISMECGQIFWGHTGFTEFNVFYNMVVGGAFCYLIIKDLFLTIEKLKDPDNDKVEVMDL